MIITKSPVRISFAGGGTDMEAYYKEYGGAVVSTSIDKYFYTFFRLRGDNKIQIISSDFQSTLGVNDLYELKFGKGFDIPAAVIKYFEILQGFDLFMASEVPPGSGLGSSGAVAVNLVYLCSLLERKNLSKEDVAEIAYSIGHDVLKLPIGKQDEYASACGGLNLIEFSKKGVDVQPLDIKEKTKKKLEKNMLLFFTGTTRASSTILRRQDNSARKKNLQVIKVMDNVKKGAYAVKRALEQGDLEKFGHLLGEAWEYKKKMSQGITNKSLDRIYELAIKNGALGGKISGAGGGGYFMLYCEEKKQERLKGVLENEGLKMLDFKFDNQGVSILK